MPERLIRPRRPVGWNQLLRKSHAHVPRNSGRGAARRALDAEVEDALAAWDDACPGDEGALEDPSPDAHRRR